MRFLVGAVVKWSNRVYKDAASNDPAGNSSAATMCQPVSDADPIAIQVLVNTCTK